MFLPLSFSFLAFLHLFYFLGYKLHPDDLNKLIQHHPSFDT